MTMQFKKRVYLTKDKIQLCSIRRYAVFQRCKNTEKRTSFRRVLSSSFTVRRFYTNLRVIKDKKLSPVMVNAMEKNNEIPWNTFFGCIRPGNRAIFDLEFSPWTYRGKPH